MSACPPLGHHQILFLYVPLSLFSSGTILISGAVPVGESMPIFFELFCFSTKQHSAKISGLSSIENFPEK